MAAEPLVATGNFVEIKAGKDTWTKDGEKHEREFTAARLEYMGGQHFIRQPYEGGDDALKAAFSGIAAGTEVAVPVRINPMGRLELVSGGKARKTS